MKIYENSQLRLLKRSLNVYTNQHNAISENIGNANNDRFVRRNTDFSEMLTRVDNNSKLRATNERHIGSPEQPDPLIGQGAEEDVDLSEEMSLLAENHIRFDFAAQILRRRFEGLQASILGRSR